MNWTLKFLPEAQKDFEQLAGNQKLLVAKALDKVVQNPVSIYERLRQTAWQQKRHRPLRPAEDQAS